MPSIWVTLPKCQAGPLAHRTPLRREQGPLKPPSFPTGSSHSSFQLMRNAMEAHAHTFIRDRRRAHCLSQSLIVHQGNGFQKRSHCYWKGNPGTVLMGLQAASVSGHQVQARAWQMPPHMSFSGTSRGPCTPMCEGWEELLCGHAHHADEGEGLPRAAYLPRPMVEPQAPWPGEGTCSNPLTPTELGARCSIRGPKATLRFSVGLEGPRTQQSCCAQGYGFLQ